MAARDLLDGKDLGRRQAAREGDDVRLFRELEQLTDHRGGDALRPLGEALAPMVSAAGADGRVIVPSAIRAPRSSSPAVTNASAHPPQSAPEATAAMMRADQERGVASPYLGREGTSGARRGARIEG